ncbi:MAG: hypothetical protein K0S00_4454 [Xanthobacteraceae bacterium]|jgi:protein gp37|nr:hypothetical protein [Xanthobacteraceae bacterium]
MADRSAIEWTDATWNPIVGCSLVSPGCTNCYAMRIAHRFKDIYAGRQFAGEPAEDLTRVVNEKPVWTGQLVLAPEHILTQPLRWRRPRRIFVNSMGDLLHESVPDEWIDRVFAVMALTPQHTYQVLTKRSARMRAYLEACRRTAGRQNEIRAAILEIADGRCAQDAVDACRRVSGAGDLWRPLPNVWLGVSTEDQRRADERVPDLLATPAAIRFVSAEPLLGPIDLSAYMWPVHGWWRGPYNSYVEAKAAGAECGLKRQALVGAWCTFLDFVIVGGESGPHARPMHPDWARTLRDQCAAAGTAFFFKQWGEWLPMPQGGFTAWRAASPRRPGSWRGHADFNDGDGGKNTHSLGPVPSCLVHAVPGDAGRMAVKIGKKAAGRLLDGVEHNAMPEVR